MSQVPTPTRTADKVWAFARVLHGKTLHEWVQYLHLTNYEAHGWEFGDGLRPGQFGYDNLVHTAAAVITADPRPSVDAAAAMVHGAWMHNYVHWRTAEPWEAPDGFKRPYNGVAQARRDALLVPYARLPPDEQAKDLLLATALLKATQ